MNTAEQKNLKEPKINPFTSVTTLSKITALVAFILLPFIGFYFGVVYQKTNTVNCVDLLAVPYSTDKKTTAKVTTTSPPNEDVTTNLGSGDTPSNNTALESVSYNPNTGWKIYENNENNFKIEYPADYYVTQEGYWGDRNSPDETFYLDLSKYRPSEVPPREFDGIRIIVSDFSGDLYKEVQEKATGFREYDPEKPPEIEKTTVSRTLAYRIFNSYVFSNNGLLYSINNGIDENLFTKILSTFEFIK